METTLMDAPPVVEKQSNPFERFLTVWVARCMVAGVVLGRYQTGQWPSPPLIQKSCWPRTTLPAPRSHGAHNNPRRDCFLNS